MSSVKSQIELNLPRQTERLVISTTRLVDILSTTLPLIVLYLNVF